jgi:hypothetical protein
MDKLVLHKIHHSEEGKRIDYEYIASTNILKYFVTEKPFYTKYQIDISKVPNSISVIPFLSNMLPIAWYAGFVIEVDEVDETFYNTQKLVRAEFSKRENTKITGRLVAKRLIKSKIDGDKTAMLFSGGVDAYATYIRIYEENPDLITLLGADIEIKDEKQWEGFTNFIENEELLKKNHKEYIETNLRDFYTYQVELLLKDIGWWGKVQHGLALIGSIAPISYLLGYKTIYIASSYTDHIDIDWGSTPEIDEKISWASEIKVFHDGYELKRQDKVDIIANFAAIRDTRFRLRVCYSEKRTEFNCSICEKCFRTILGLILNDKNPNDYGFNVDAKIYDKFYEVLNIGGASKGVRYFWWELMEKAKNTDKFYVFDNLETETKQIEDIRNGKIDKLLEEKINNPAKEMGRLKFIIRNKFPGLIKLYKKIK